MIIYVNTKLRENIKTWKHSLYCQEDNFFLKIFNSEKCFILGDLFVWAEKRKSIIKKEKIATEISYIMRILTVGTSSARKILYIQHQNFQSMLLYLLVNIICQTLGRNIFKAPLKWFFSKMALFQLSKLLSWNFASDDVT